MAGYQFANNNPLSYNDPTGAYPDGYGAGPPPLPQFTWPDPGYFYSQSWPMPEYSPAFWSDDVYFFSNSDVIIVIKTPDPYDLIYWDGVPKGSAPQGSYRDDPNARVFESYDAYWRAYEAAAQAAQQGDPGKGWFTKFGELFEKNYNGGVVYDGDAWYGSNFIGPSDAVDPYKIPDPKRPGQFLKPKDMVDAAAQRHDSYYYQLEVDGWTGALFATRVTFADQILAAEAYKAFTGYFRGDIDPVTGNAISPRTRDVAFDIMVSFGLIGGGKSKF